MFVTGLSDVALPSVEVTLLTGATAQAERV